MMLEEAIESICLSGVTVEFLVMNVIPHLPEATVTSRLLGRKRETERLIRALECTKSDERFRIHRELIDLIIR